MPHNGQWGWAEFEELLQCPVCLEVPATGPGITVEQCIHGHHLCFSCKSKLENCPLCKCAFHGTRNFVVEELIRHFEILKNTMLLHNLVVEKRRAKKKRKMELNAAAGGFQPVPEPPRRNVNTPNPNKGRYPCRVDDCDAILPVSRLLNHVRSHHAENLTESIVDFNHTYSQIWEVQFINKRAVNSVSYVVFVSGIGLVFLTLEILRTGQLIAVVRTNMKYMEARGYMANLEFYSETGTHSHLLHLVSVRENIVNMMKQGNCFFLQKNQLKALCVGKKFNCKLRLSKFDVDNVDLLASPTQKHDLQIIAGIRASLLEEEEKKIKTLSKSQLAKNRNVLNEFEEMMKTLNSVSMSEFIQSISSQSNVNNVATPAPPLTQNGKRKKKNKKRR